MATVRQSMCQTLTATMNLDGIVEAAPDVLEALTREIFVNSDAAMLADSESQLSPHVYSFGLSFCIGYARHVEKFSICIGPFDAHETLNRAAIEARDLLMHFRFKDADTRKRIGHWFTGAK